MTAVFLAAVALSLAAYRPTIADENAPIVSMGAHGPGWRLIKPDERVWQDSAVLPPGAQIAMLDGDSAKPEFFAMLLKMPDGYTIPAHSHSQPERVTVISGTLNLGTVTRDDPLATEILPAGSFSSMPRNMVHFGSTTGETLLLLTSIGPWTVKYVNPSDDPRTKH